jgi:hypothetical protein
MLKEICHGKNVIYPVPFSCMAEYIVVTSLIRGGNKKKGETVSRFFTIFEKIPYLLFFSEF